MPTRAHVALRLVIAAGLLYAIGRWVVSPHQLLASGSDMSIPWVALATLLMPLGLVLQWWKWRQLVMAALPEISAQQIARSLLTGFGLGLLTPGRLGELGRGASWAGVRWQAVALAGADRLLSSSVTLALGGLCALMTLSSLQGPLVAGSLLILCVAVGMIAHRLGARLPARYALPVRRVGRHAWQQNLAAAVVFNMLFFTQMYCLIRALGPVEPQALLAIPVMFAVKTLLPISFLDLGVREGAAIVVLGMVGVAPAAAVQAALMLFALNVLAPGAAGLLVLCFDARAASHPSQRAEFAHVR